MSPTLITLVFIVPSFRGLVSDLNFGNWRASIHLGPPTPGFLFIKGLNEGRWDTALAHPAAVLFFYLPDQTGIAVEGELLDE
jgi:hypothetical protein